MNKDQSNELIDSIRNDLEELQNEYDKQSKKTEVYRAFGQGNCHQHDYQIRFIIERITNKLERILVNERHINKH